MPRIFELFRVNDMSRGSMILVRALSMAWSVFLVSVDISSFEASRRIRRMSDMICPRVDRLIILIIGAMDRLRYLGKNALEVPLYRRIGMVVINFFSRLGSNSVVNDPQSGFKAFSSKAFEAVMQVKTDGYGIETELLALAMKSNLRIVEVPITIRYKGIGKTSKKNPILQGAEMIGTALRLILDKIRARIILLSEAN